MSERAEQCESNESQIRIERRLLSALAEDAISSDVREAIKTKFNGHKFADSDHELIYRALAITRRVRSVNDKAALIQALTRMGFPDVEIELLFSENPPDENEVMELLRQI